MGRKKMRAEARPQKFAYYSNPTVTLPVCDSVPHYALASSHKKDLGAGAPRTPRHTVGYCTPAHARGKRAAQNHAKRAHSERKTKNTVILQYPPHYSTPTVTPSPPLQYPTYHSWRPTHTYCRTETEQKEPPGTARDERNASLPPPLPPTI